MFAMPVDTLDRDSMFHSLVAATKETPPLVQLDR